MKISKASLKRRPVVVGSGLIALDVVLSDGMPPRRWAGGSCGNILTTLSYLGWEAFPIARLAEDVAGQIVRQDLSTWGVQLDFIATSPARPTPVIVERIKRTAHGTRHSFSWRCPSCGAHLPGFSPIVSSAAEEVASEIVAHDVFFLDRVSRGILDLAEASSKQGAIVVFEPSGVNDPRLFKEALALAHILKYSHERMSDAGDLLAPENAPNLLLQIETLGADGLRFRSCLAKCKTRTWVARPAFEISNLRDSAGAGDWCTAGLLHGLARRGRKAFQQTTREALEAAFQFGQALAAWNCAFEGARGGMYLSDKKSLATDIEAILAQHGSTARLATTGGYQSDRDQLALICAACDSSAPKASGVSRENKTAK
jgi:sugar/nucleoside kinase (ribokinase family)